MKVLLVDDHPLFLDGLRNLLSAHGLAVAGTARDGLEALEQARALRPDLVLMDIHLPGRDGLSIVHEFRLDPVGGSTPIVALTAHAMRGDRERFLAGGCTGYMAKPIDARTFADEVRRYLI